MKNRLNTLGTKVALGIMALAPISSFADAPLDLATTGTTIAGYVATAAAAGLGVAAAIWGVRIILKAFKAVAK